MPNSHRPWRLQSKKNCAVTVAEAVNEANSIVIMLLWIS